MRVQGLPQIRTLSHIGLKRSVLRVEPQLCKWRTTGSNCLQRRLLDIVCQPSITTGTTFLILVTGAEGCIEAMPQCIRESYARVSQVKVLFVCFG